MLIERKNLCLRKAESNLSLNTSELAIMQNRKHTLPCFGAFSIVFILLLHYSFMNSFLIQEVSAQLNKQEFLTYSDPSYGFRIKYPSYWNVEPSSQNSNLSNHNIVVRFYPKISERANNTFFADVAIVVFSSVTNQTVKELANQAIDHYRKTLQGFELISTNNSFFKEDKQSYFISYLYQDPYFGKFQTMQFWTMFQNTVFIINYDAKPNLYHQNLNIVQEMITSFEASTNLKGLVSV